jgi:hypothetical protein
VPPSPHESPARDPTMILADPSPERLALTAIVVLAVALALW